MKLHCTKPADSCVFSPMVLDFHGEAEILGKERSQTASTLRIEIVWEKPSGSEGKGNGLASSEYPL